MAQKSVNASFTETLQNVAVASGPGSAGQNSGISTVTTLVQIDNSRVGGPIEFKAGAADWVFLDEEQGTLVEINLATTALLFRKASPVAGTVTAKLTLLAYEGLLAAGKYKVASSVEGGGNPVTVSGASGIGQVAVSVFAAGWSYTSIQWKRVTGGSTVDIAGATGTSYVQQAADVVAGVRIYPQVTGLVYSPAGLTGTGGGGGGLPAGAMLLDAQAIYFDADILVFA